jgi:hypothetical protein
MDSNEQDELFNVALLAGAGFALYFLVVKPLLNLGGDDPADTNSLANQVATTPASNPFNYQFDSGLYAQDPSTYGSSFWNNLSSENSAWFTDYSSDTNLKYAKWGESVWSASSDWGSPDADMTSVFNLIATQADASNIAAYLNFVRNADLWTLLNKGQGSIASFLPTGMSNKALAALVNHVNSLPVS